MKEPPVPVISKTTRMGFRTGFRKEPTVNWQFCFQKVGNCGYTPGPGYYVSEEPP